MPKSRATTKCGRCHRGISVGQRVVRFGAVSWHVSCAADYLRERRARKEQDSR